MPGYVLVKNGIVRDAEASKEEEGDAAELRYSAEMIAELASNAPGQSIGVLFRENRKVAMMIDLLRQSGVSASQEGGNPLADSAAVYWSCRWFIWPITRAILIPPFMFKIHR